MKKHIIVAIIIIFFGVAIIGLNFKNTFNKEIQINKIAENL